MNGLDKYAYWQMLTDYDLGTIDTLIAGRRWVYVAYLCQQAAERQLKSMYVYYMDAEPPNTHNVNFLFAKVTGCAGFKAETDMERFATYRDDCEGYLSDVMLYYMSDYPSSNKHLSNRFVGEKQALELADKTRAYVRWLRSFQPDVTIPAVPE